MAAPPSIIDPFHRKIYEALAPDIDNRMISLASGSAGTIEDYKFQAAYIQAFNDVLGKCREIELEIYGKRPTTEAAE